MSKALNNIDLTAAQRKEVAALLQRYLPDTEVWAYGSRAKFTAKPHSDLDMVAFASKEQSQAVADLREAFEESYLPFRVDLFVWDETPEEFRRNIEEARVVVQEKKKGCELPEGWQTVTVGEISEVIGGGTPSSKVDEYWGGSIPWLTPKDLSGYDFRRVKSGKRNITDSGLANSSARLLPKNTVLVTSRAPIGYVALANNEIATNQGFKSLILNDGYDPDFFYYLIKHNVPTLEAVSSGTTFKEISGKAFKQIKFNVPPLPEQKAIAHILGSLDDKIELNRRMNETLEAMAQALFKSWFVNFDPVIDNALAAGNTIPDELKEKAAIRQGLDDKRKSLPNDIRRLFPSEFAYTEEMGWIPKGWSIQSLYEIATFINGAAYKNFDFTDEPEALPIVKIAEIKNGISSQTKFTKTILADKYRISNGDILFSWSGNPDTSIDTFIWTGGDAWLNQHIFKVLPKNNKEKSLVYYQLRILKTKFSEIARNKQTTGLGHVTAQDMKNMYITKCPSAILSLFNNSADLLLDRYYLNLMDIKNQSKIQDALLSRLLSGEIRAPNFDSVYGGKND